MDQYDYDGDDMWFGDLTHIPSDAYRFNRRDARPLPDMSRSRLPDDEVLSAPEYARLRFVRWLLRTGRLDP